MKYVFAFNCNKNCLGRDLNFQRIDKIFFFIDVDAVPCPAKNKNIMGNDIHQEVVSSWDECGEYNEQRFVAIIMAAVYCMSHRYWDICKT